MNVEPEMPLDPAPACHSDSSGAIVASAIEFFLAAEAGFLTGNALDVDGGAHLGILPGT